MAPTFVIMRWLFGRVRRSGRSSHSRVDSASESSVLVAGWSITVWMVPSEPTNANPTSWVSP